nr:MAG TPA: hypothetical protein [Caudoviricetes sp.]
MPRKSAYYKPQVVLFIKKYNTNNVAHNIQEAIHFSAIERSKDEIVKMEQGLERLKVIDAHYFDNKKRMEGIALDVGISERKAWMWCNDFVKIVAKNAGYY